MAMTDKFTNELTDAEVERLAILSEELGEAQQCIGKILRHGYESRNPHIIGGATNREQLECELGDVVFAINQLMSKDLNGATISGRVASKTEAIKPYLHHQ